MAKQDRSRRESHANKARSRLLREFLAESPNSKIDTRAARRLCQAARRLADHEGRAGPELSRTLRTIELRRQFTPTALALLQELMANLGVKTARNIALPRDDRPIWLRGEHPFANHQSNPELPSTTDVVVIGAGLTGASAAYHLALANAERTLRIVILDQGDPATEASGRNGGNFELIPENSVGIYDSLANERVGFLRKRYPGLPAEVLRAEGERQASVVLGLALRNRARLKEIIREEVIDCDFSPRGWLHLAHSDHEEQGICDEVSFAAAHGQRIEIWSRSRIFAEFGIRTKYLGRFIPNDGSYHPFKFVCGLLRSALRRGVELHTRTAVHGVKSLRANHHRVVTARGEIVAKIVIVATNAFTRNLLPEMRAIRPRQSQIMITEHAPDRARGRIVTSEEGPVYFNQPRAGVKSGRAPLLMGGGNDRTMKNPASRRRSKRVHSQLLRLRDRFFPDLRGQPPSTEWVGALGYTPDQLPAIGFLRPGLVIAAGFNGYGGSYTIAAGRAAAEMALRRSTPEWVPEDVFSPLRLLNDTPLFMHRQNSLWRIAASLCRQLKATHDRITDLLSYDHAIGNTRVPIAFTSGLTRFKSSPARSIAPEQLQAYPLFAEFSLAELTDLLGRMRRWDLTVGALLFEEGDVGGTAFIIVSGSVDVSIRIRDRQHLLATLPPGSIFGQISLFGGEARAASCVVSADAVLAEIEREPCRRLFSSNSRTALKFLASLNQGVIDALRAADRRFMHLNLEGRPTPQRDLRV